MKPDWDDAPELSIADLVRTLEEWFALHRRSLPWREDPTPYHVWVSEIMLQQTRVEAVRGYYERFLKALPTIESLSAASEDTLLKLWEGLGYYNRVRNMQQAARTVMEQYGGEFPDTYAEILQLKGIGEYTAGAIASIAFGEAVPAVDGNVLRVISRLLGSFTDIQLISTKRDIKQWLQGVVSLSHPGQFNQALMDLGATVCIPNGAPRCSECPWSSRCAAYRNGWTQQLPVKAPKAQRRKEDKTVLLLFAEDRIALTKRPEKGLLAGMWQFPMVDSHLSLQQVRELLFHCGLQEYTVRSTRQARHVFSHVEWQMKGRIVTLPSIPAELIIAGQAITWVSASQLQQDYSIPSAFSVYRALALQRINTELRRTSCARFGSIIISKGE